MYVVGLTGGMGSGKSTVSDLLEERGAFVVNADLIAREVVEPGEPALDELAAHFGDDILLPDGRLDRPALAARAFQDEEAHQALNRITHPRIAQRMMRRLRDLAAMSRINGHQRIVVVDHPLLIETGDAYRFPAVVVVTAPEEVRIERLQKGRKIDPDDARARMATQVSDDQRRAVATHVIDNSGGLEALKGQVDWLWRDLQDASNAAVTRGRAMVPS